MKVHIEYTREDFLQYIGREPEQDDLQRASCQMAGSIGHQDCGICAKHFKPIFCCSECFSAPREPKLYLHNTLQNDLELLIKILL